MDEFERELRAALGRREPPGDFAGRVMARLEPARLDAPAKVRPLPRRRWQPAVAGAIAAGLAAMTLGVFEYREYQRGLEAKQQLMFALELTAQKLHVAQDKVNQRNQ